MDVITLLWILTIAAFGLAMWAQFKVKGNFNKWMKVPTSSGITGAEVARRILDSNGLYDVPVEPVPGKLTDHYDPISRTVRLSEPVYYGHSIASVSVAAHEVGHAVQHKEHYGALVLRHRMFPLANFGSSAAPMLLIAGLIFSWAQLTMLGIIFFSAAVAFQLVTLPVEFNASSRAKVFMLQEGMIRNNEERGVNKVLGAAALTYVASALIALLELLRFVAIFMQQREE